MILNIQKFAVTKSTTFKESDISSETNTSTLKITIKFSAGNNVTYFTSKKLSCTCAGQTQSANVSLSKGGSVTKTFTFNDIQHNQDGTKTVSWNWSIPTGTSVLGTLTDSGTKTLTPIDLHKAPDNIQTICTETNTRLLELFTAEQINNLIVMNLSIKSFAITADTYDDATITQYKIRNTLTNVFTSATSPITINLSQSQLAIDQDKNKVALITFVTDSKGFTGPIGALQPVYYNYVPYIKPNIINTSTFIKRDGQTSGKAKLTIEGTFYNIPIESVSNSISLSYKYWEKGTTEPSTYISISSSDITITNNNFKVTGLQIGTTDESQANWFDPEKAYNVQVKVVDNYNSTQTLIEPLSIPVGEALWTEYKDRVDFKKITIKQQEILAPFVLYESSGSDTSITLEDDASNYKYMEIFYSNSEGNTHSSTKIYEPNGKQIGLYASRTFSTTTRNYSYSALWTITGTNINFLRGQQIHLQNNGQTQITAGNYISIYRVIGYK